MKVVAIFAAICVLTALLCQPVNAGTQMVLIPAGNNIGTDPDFGAYSLTVSSFYMDRYEVTKALWDEVYTWAVVHGYSFDNAGSGKAADHPVLTDNWYDCVKWCNARSEKEGRPVSYRVGGSVYRNGTNDAVTCDMNAAGYRLPTDVEWHYAARGGVSGKRFPWGDTIDHDQANYYSQWSGGSPYYSYDTGYAGHDRRYSTTGYPYTAPVGSFAANSYGLYDMVGNGAEWCWDWYPGNEGSSRVFVFRGGCWAYGAYACRVAARFGLTPDIPYRTVGFRTVLPTGQSNLNDGLVAYYPFNGNANDESGNGNEGLVYGATLTTDRFGAPNKAFNFDGLSSRVFIADSASLSITNSLTLAAFINASQQQNEYASQIIFRGDDRNALDPYSLVLIDGGTLLFLIDDDINNSVSLQAPISPTEWHQVVGTLDGTSGQMRLFIDGVVVASTNTAVRPFGLLTGPQPGLGLGHLQSADPSFKGCFKGVLDEVRIYNRALSSSDVAQLYTSGGGVTPQTSIANVRASQTAGTKMVEGYYDVSGAFSTIPVAVMISTNGGASYDVNGPNYSAVAPGNNRSFSWDMSTAFNNKQCSQMRIKVVAGSAVAESPVFTVDTSLARQVPIVQDIMSQHADRRRHVYFLAGVSLSQEFTAAVDWNGKTPGTVRFTAPGGTYSSTSNKRTFNVGSEFGVGGALHVTAIAADGTASQSVRANFDVIPPPPGLDADWFRPVTWSDSLKYDTLKVSFKVLDASPETVPDNIPWFGGEDIGFISTAEGHAEIGGDGSASMSLSTRVGSQINMGGFKITPGIKGRPEWHYSPTLEQWQIGGYVGAELKAAYHTPSYYLPIVVPVFFRADVNVDNALMLGIRGWNPDNTPQFSGKWEFNGKLKGVLGCGASRFLAAEGYIGGGPVWTIEYQPEPTWEKLGIELNGGVRVVALYWVYDNQLLHYAWWKYGGPSEMGQAAFVQALTEQLNNPDASQFRLMSRDYLKRSALSDPATAQRTIALADASHGTLSVSENTLQADIYPYSEPALSVCGSNRVMVWIGDDPARTDENRTELLWSKWVDAGWANPTSVWNDGTADFAPVLAVLPDGSALAAWQNERSILTNGATLDNALAGLEIAVAQYDPATGSWVSTNLTDNLHIDRSPELSAATNGTALLTWISNPSNDVNGTVTNLNTIACRRWTGTEWLDAGDISTAARMLLWSTVAWSGSNGVFLAAIDADDDQATVEDQELFGSTFDGAAWTPFVQLTTNAVQDTRPQAAYDSAGNLMVAWYQSSNIVMRVGDLDLASPSEVGAVGGASSARDFRLVTGPAGQISMVWEDVAEDGTGPDPFMFNYDLALSAWSNPLRLMNNTNLLERSFSATFATNGALLMAYNRVHIQTDTNGVPLFTNNVVDLAFLDYQIGGDLGIKPSEILISTNNPAPGQTVDVSALVRNLGEIGATNVTVAFFDGNPVNGGSQIGTTQTVTELPAGAGTNVLVSWTLPLAISNQAVYVVVDPALDQQDRNRANNTASKAAVSPDLVVSEMSVLHSSSSGRMVNAKVENVGWFASGTGFDVTFRRGGTNGLILATTAMDPLPAGGQFDANYEWDLSGSTFTTAFETVYAVADPNSAVSEAEKGNNLGMVQVMTTLDTDDDGLLDGEELRYGSDVNVPDTDGDGLEDGAEVHTHGTSPILADSDGDGMKDGDEVRAGTDPTSTADVFAITSVDTKTGLNSVLWSAKSSKTYQVIQSAELLTWTNAPSGAGTDQQSQQTAISNAVMRYVDPQSVSNSPAFYRVNIVE